MVFNTRSRKDLVEIPVNEFEHEEPESFSALNISEKGFNVLDHLKMKKRKAMENNFNVKNVIIEEEKVE